MHLSASKSLSLGPLMAFCIVTTIAAATPVVAQTGETSETNAAAQQSEPTVTLERNRIKAPDLKTPGTEAHYFSDVDYSNDYRLNWEEMITFYEPEIREGGWTLTEFWDEFDTDGDEFLDEEEYSDFLGEVGLEEPKNRSSFIEVD